MLAPRSTLTVLAVAALATTSVDAHGTLSKPALTWSGSAYGGDFSATVPMTALTPVAGEKFTHYPDANLNAASFEKSFKASSYKTLKDFLLKNQDMSKGRSKMAKTAECGFTAPEKGKAQALPDQLEWYGGVMNHPGPCEFWCDDEIVIPFTGNCAKTFPAGKFTYAKAKCVGKKRLTMYWMSTLLEWQVYIQCANIGGGGATASTGGNTAKEADTPAAGGAGGNNGGAAATTTKPATNNGGNANNSNGGNNNKPATGGNNGGGNANNNGGNANNNGGNANNNNGGNANNKPATNNNQVNNNNNKAATGGNNSNNQGRNREMDPDEDVEVVDASTETREYDGAEYEAGEVVAGPAEE